jgi:hypothetical protein
MEEGMAEDRMEWCEAHADPVWDTHDPLVAACFYHDYLQERLNV